MEVEEEEEHAELSRVSAQYTARLDRTLKGLQARVKEQEVALEKLRASTNSIQTQPSEDPTTHLQQLNTLKLTYDSLTEAQPSLPSTESPIPGLLALRSTHRTIEETKECITQTEIDYKKLKQRLDKEQADLQDAKLMQNAMEARVTSLQGDIEAQTQKTPAQIARDMIRELGKRKASYDSETMKLVKAFNGFIDDHLAAMLAAEELGGPIVGELLDVDEETLEVGFNAQGKVKKTKVKVKEDKRQRRIDEIWGPQPAEDVELEEPWDEKRAAAAEMRGLTEQLLNRLLEVDGSGSGAYVELERESAAARFLVRSKVAQFHPRDARQLRLIDFGGEVED